MTTFVKRRKTMEIKENKTIKVKNRKYFYLYINFVTYGKLEIS